MTQIQQLLHNLPNAADSEVFETLLQHPQVRIERIVSHGQCSPDGFWYDQDEHEWVLLLQGSAELQFDQPATHLKLQPGDAIHIPAHQRHRVIATAANQDTVWLAVFYRDSV